MGEYSATVYWQRNCAVFTDNRYSRIHTLEFDEGVSVAGSSFPHVECFIASSVITDVRCEPAE
jgi:hypothetical protein